MALASVNRVRYAGLDFDTHVDDLRARLQVKFAAEYNDFALASMGMMLLDMISYGLDTLSFYLDRRATEVYLSTARTRRGVARIARQLGYKMGGAVASSTDLSVQIPITAAKSFTVPITPGFQFQGPNGLIFEAAETVNWSPAEQAVGTTKQVPVYEGETITETFTSNGTANQVFELARTPSGKLVASGSVSVTVDGAVWDEKDFLEFEQTDHYEVGYNDDPATLRFGDGSAGNIPVTGATITATYVATTGKAGNVARQTIQAEVSPLVVAGETVTLVVDNPSKSSGGDDSETIESAKSFAGKVFNSRKVAVTGPDYDALAGSYADPVYGRVAAAKAISSRSASQDLALQDALLTIASALQGPVDTIRDEIDSATNSSTGTLGQILDDTTIITTQLDNIATSLTTIGTNATALVSGIRSNRNLTLDIDADVDDAKQDASDGDTLVSGITVGGSDQLQASTQNTLLGYFGNIDALMDAIKTRTATIRAASDTQVAAGGLINDEVNKVGTSITSIQLDGSDSYLKALEDARASIVVVVGSYDSGDPTASTGLFRSFNYTLEAVADTLDPSLAGDAAAVVATQLQVIFDHVDNILSNDCQANLITVPILVRDAAGFYTEPSNGLISSLNTYLNERKEVTQTVEVVSGGKFIIYPVITVRLGVTQGYSLEQSRTAAETVIDGLLRDRKFGVDLYVTDIAKKLLEIEGVNFCNVTIDGYTTVLTTTTQTDKLDSSGNLIIDKSEVITKLPGSVTVNPEAVVPQVA